MMELTRKKKTRTTLLALTSILLLAQTPLAGANEDIAGVWEMTMDFSGRQSHATLTISEKIDGTLTGKWGSGELSDVAFENGKLTFVRTIRFGDGNFAMHYTGTLKNDKLEGLFSSDRGEFAAKGTRKKPKLLILGQWDIRFKVEGRDTTGRLTVSETPDGTLEGTWGLEEGEHVISNVEFEDRKLTFVRKSKVNDFELETRYVGIVDGDRLLGTFRNDTGQWAAEGKRVGAALVGAWELTSTSERGTRTGMMWIESDLTGRYEFFGGEIPMKDFTLEGNQVMFSMEPSFGDQTFSLDFKGTLDDNVIKGEISSDRGTTQITGKKLQPALSIVGRWEFTRETSGGTRTSTLTINEDMTGTYAFRNSRVAISDLIVEGHQVSFKIAVVFDDRAFRMDFKGKVDGDTLKGVFTTERGSREATGKRIK